MSESMISKKDWSTESLGDLCEIIIGRTPSRNRPEFWGGEHPWLSIADMNQGRLISITKEKITTEGAKESGSRLIPTGTVLLSFKLSIGKVAVADIATYTNEAIAALPVLDTKKLNRDFLFWTLLSIRLDEEVDVAAKGKTLNSKKLARLQIPLPPLDEQKRIAAVLDKADALRRQRQESLQLTEKLIQSVFIGMFVRNPVAADWTPRRVEWMAKETKGAIRTGPFGSQLLHSEFVDHGIAVLGIDNAVKNRFEWGQPRFITPEKYHGLNRYKVFPGDIIITIMGTLGRCAIVPDDIPESINTKHLCCITLNREKCLPEFLHAAFLNHPDVLRQLGVRVKGAVMPGLNMGIIKELELPIPPIALQKKFMQIVAMANASRIDFESSQDMIESLFGSLQQQAFRGELDLSRLTPDLAADTFSALEPAKTVTKRSRARKAARFLHAPTSTEAALKQLDRQVSKGESIPWSVDYFKYRIVASEPAPFSFANLMRMAETVFDEAPPYEEIKDMIFDLLGQDGQPALLRQRFDLNEVKEKDSAGNEVTSFEGRKEIVFEPMP
jgi:type I restriction enzyme S subunit